MDMASLPKLPKQSTPNGMKLKPASSQGDKCLAILFDSAILAALPMTKLAGGTAACMGDMTVTSIQVGLLFHAYGGGKRRSAGRNEVTPELARPVEFQEGPRQLTGAFH